MTHGQQHTGLRARGLARALLAALLLAAGLPLTTAAAGNGAIVVRGIQHEYGSCEKAGELGYLMTAAAGQSGPALEGCWFVETFFVDPKFDGMAHFMAVGVERFEGWLGNVQGTLHTTYIYTAKTEGDYTSFLEIHGRCHHPITWGEGGFAGVSGELSFTDVVDVNPPYYPYWGAIRLDGGSTTVATAPTTSRTAAASVSATGGSGGVTC
ncbi:MAG TPA: hypothetical protein VF484_02025 [Candidatus Limnocylindrales bacterium]